VLYALWCLGDIERVEALEAEAARVQANSMMPLTDVGVRNLNQARSRLMADLRRRPRGEGDGMSLEQLATFPGMPRYGLDS
jgi:hypothetical protein